MGSLFATSISVKKQITIRDEEFFLLRDFIYDKCGIFVADNRKYLLENRLLNRIKALGLKNYGEYYYYLKYDRGASAELSSLYRVVTTNETSFYRNPPQLKILENGLLQSLKSLEEKNGSRELHILSAGCSTGEEPYTLAMIIREVFGPRLSSFRVSITAGDLSEGVLASARRGEYSEYALRTTPAHIVDKYFSRISGGRYRVNDEIKKMVSYRQVNLKDRWNLRTLQRSQIVFCRNVLIYFDDPMKKQVISCFYDNLLPGGYLFIGHSESLHNITPAFTPKHHPGAIVYQKKE
ncbi:CheR family methyltransferase [Desulfoplanes sp.]